MSGTSLLFLQKLHIMGRLWAARGKKRVHKFNANDLRTRKRFFGVCRNLNYNVTGPLSQKKKVLWGYASNASKDVHFLINF